MKPALKELELLLILLVCLFCETVFTESLKFTALICSDTVIFLNFLLKHAPLQVILHALHYSILDLHVSY
jgi:hypothetical protein